MEDKIYKDRILQRAHNQKIFDYGAVQFSDLDDSKKEFILENITSRYEPLIIFWDTKDRWTALTVDKIFSRYGGKIHSCKLDDIQNDIEGIAPHGGLHDKYSLRSTEMLFLRKPMIGIWVPAGEGLHSLWHILKYCRR